MYIFLLQPLQSHILHHNICYIIEKNKKGNSINILNMVRYLAGYFYLKANQSWCQFKKNIKEIKDEHRSLIIISTVGKGKIFHANKWEWKSQQYHYNEPILWTY